MIEEGHIPYTAHIVMFRYSYTEHQHRIRERLRYKFGNVKCDILVYRVKLLTQELKATSSKVSYHRKKIQQDRINHLFAKKPNFNER